MGLTVPTTSNMTLLWTNPNPTKQFDPQTISLDLSGYDGVVVTGRISINSPEGGAPAIMFDANINTMLIFPSGYRIRWRYASWNESGVTFDVGRVDSYNSGTGGTPDNRWAIPMKIFGIKM